VLQAIRKLIAPVLGAVAVVGGSMWGLVAYDRPAQFVVMHHQAGTAWAKPEQARAWFKSQGYEDVAYNALITPKGEVWPGRGEGFMSAANKGLNAKSVAFCFLGNLDKAPPTDAQLVAAGLWVRAALKRHPGAKLIQHKDVAKLARDPSVATGCPGKEAQRMNAARAVFLIASGHTLQEAKARAAAGR
jgi:hypothetical protein